VARVSWLYSTSTLIALPPGALLFALSLPSSRMFAFFFCIKAHFLSHIVWAFWWSSKPHELEDSPVDRHFHRFRSPFADVGV